MYDIARKSVEDDKYVAAEDLYNQLKQDNPDDFEAKYLSLLCAEVNKFFAVVEGAGYFNATHLQKHERYLDQISSLVAEGAKKLDSYSEDEYDKPLLKKLMAHIVWFVSEITILHARTACDSHGVDKFYLGSAKTTTVMAFQKLSNAYDDNNEKTLEYLGVILSKIKKTFDSMRPAMLSVDPWTMDMEKLIQINSERKIKAYWGTRREEKDAIDAEIAEFTQKIQTEKNSRDSSNELLSQKESIEMKLKEQQQLLEKSDALEKKKQVDFQIKILEGSYNDIPFYKFKIRKELKVEIDKIKEIKLVEANKNLHKFNDGVRKVISELKEELVKINKQVEIHDAPYNKKIDEYQAEIEKREKMLKREV